MHTEPSSLYYLFLLYDTISTNLKSNLKAAHWNRQSNIWESMNLTGLVIVQISLESSRISKKCHQMFQNGSRESSWLDVWEKIIKIDIEHFKVNIYKFEVGVKISISGYF